MSSYSDNTDNNEKDARVRKLEAKLKEWDAELQKLEEMAQGTAADAELKLQNNTKSLRSKWNSLNTKVQELRNAGEVAWDDLSSYFESAMNEFTDGLRSTQERFRNEQD